MPTVLRAVGFRFAIFANDHAPAHVHVFHGADSVVVNLESEDPEVRLLFGMKRGDVRRAVALTARHRNELLTAWRRIHGPTKR